MNKRMIGAAYKLRNQDEEKGIKGNQRSYTFGYTSFHKHKTLHKREHFKPLTKLVVNKAEEYASYYLGWDIEKYKLCISSLWVNINSKYSYHELHNHPESFLSGVYYLQIPSNSGGIILHDPREQLRFGEPKLAHKNSFNAKVVKWEPVAGKIFMFPGWLYHSVEQNHSDEDRVSVAFNLSHARRTRRER